MLSLVPWGGILQGHSREVRAVNARWETQGKTMAKSVLMAASWDEEGCRIDGYVRARDL
jgi:hypothetical protein